MAESLQNKQEDLRKLTGEGEKVGVGAYIALFFAILYFSGVFYNIADPAWKWLGAFDFTTLAGKYGSIAGAGNFVGKGGIGARQGFAFSLTLIPGVMLAMGILEVLTHYGALRACQVLITPLLKPLMGVPGNTALALITDLQSTDAGAAITKGMFDRGLINTKQLTIIAAWQYAGAGGVNNYFATVSALFPAFLVPVWQPLVVILLMKFVGGILIRFVMNTLYKKDFQND